MRTVNNRVLLDDEIAGLDVHNDNVIMREKSGVEISIPIVSIIRMLDVYRDRIEHEEGIKYDSYDDFLSIWIKELKNE